MSERQHKRPATHSIGLQICSSVILCLFLMRYFIVAESAGQGETLWITGLWLLSLILWATVSRRSSVNPFDWLDLCVGLLAGAHVISAIAVIMTTGEKRFALNLAWEWVGVAVGWFLLRQQCRQFDFRRELVLGLIAVGTAIAGLGLYQHYVEFPELAGKYGPLFDRLKHAEPVESKSILQVLTRDGIPTDGPSLILFEKRLRDSREPLGVFALANTLGGFLAVCLILAVNVAATAWPAAKPQYWKYLTCWIAVIVIVGWCLILTKSRTAWIGAATGLAIWSFTSGRIKWKRAQLRIASGFLIVVVVMVWAVSRLGGLDRQVLTEAPKSLQYRLQYWSATLPIIRDHFWLGVGPGQFRGYYLHYKLPEASEEIADPHNFLLEVAANGGVMALLGVLGLLAMLVRLATRPSTTQSEAKSSAVWPLATYTVIGFASVFFFIALVTGTDDRLLVLLPAAVGLWWGFRRLIPVRAEESPAVSTGSLAAALALLVHLLGAGGIGMPAVSLLLLVLVAIADAERAPIVQPASRTTWVWTGTFSGLGIVCLILLCVTSLWPVISAQRQLAAADRMVEDGFADAANTKYALAATADHFSPEPWRRRAELAYRQAVADQLRSNDSFLNAVQLLREGHSRDPSSFQDDQKLGNWWLARWRRTGEVKNAQEAVAAFQQAVNRYPTNASLLADLAVALDATGSTREARSVAEKALKQDAVNHDRGHVDRFLIGPIRARLEQLVTKPDHDKDL